MEDFVRLTGRTRYATKIVREGRLWWKESYVIVVLQVEEFYHRVIQYTPDRDGTTYPDDIVQGYTWRPATLEDLATMGERKNEPAVETYRRYSRPNGPGPSQHVGPTAPFPASQPTDDWPRVVRGYPDVPPAGFEAYTPPDVGTRAQPGSQPPPASGPSY